MSVPAGDHGADVRAEPGGGGRVQGAEEGEAPEDVRERSQRRQQESEQKIVMSVNILSDYSQ